MGRMRFKPPVFKVNRWLLFPLIAFLTLFSIGLASAMALRGLSIGDPAPDFRIRTTDNREIGRSGQKGTILILAFWRRDQDFSKLVLTDLEKIYQEYKDKGVMVLAVNADEASAKEIRQIKDALHLSYLFATDPGFRAYGLFGIMVLPSTLVIGPHGVLTAYRPIHSEHFHDQIRGEVRLLLGEISAGALEMQLNPKQVELLPDAKRKAGLHLSMARMLLNESSLKPKAKEELEKAVRFDPTLIEARILLAKLYLEDREFKKAKSELTEALKLDPVSEEARALLKIADAGQ